MDVPPESEMTVPTLTLFPSEQYFWLEQVPLGRKLIDVVCLNRSTQFTTAVELKVSDWKKALWQASLNLQVAHESYIAIWHSFVHRAANNADLLNSYGVGLISVTEASAEILLPSPDKVRRIARSKKHQWYQHLIEQEKCGTI